MLAPPGQVVQPVCPAKPGCSARFVRRRRITEVAQEDQPRVRPDTAIRPGRHDHRRAGGHGYSLAVDDHLALTIEEVEAGRRTGMLGQSLPSSKRDEQHPQLGRLVKQGNVRSVILGVRQRVPVSHDVRGIHSAHFTAR